MKMSRKPYPDALLFLGQLIAVIAILFAVIALTGCTAYRGSTIAMGHVVFPDTSMQQPYVALVPNLDDRSENCQRWMRWEPWELQDIYNIKAQPGETINCMWLSQCGQDTLARLTLTGIRGKQKTFNDTLILDGSHYYRGVKTEKR
jgi:hypothetical protein